MDPKVLVVSARQTSVVRYPSGVSGKELLSKVQQVFGLGTVDNDQGITVPQSLSVVPDGTYTFLPDESGHVADAATTFWQSLRQINMASGAIAALPANPLSLLPYEEPSFYVHPVYCQMWKIISTRTDTGRFLITGTPGIGKTSMLLFILCNLARTGRDIVLELYSKGSGRWLIKGNTVYEGQDFDFKHELSSKDCWYLCDATFPPQVSARTILISSIDNAVIPKFEKYTALTLYMPPWQWEEIEAAIPLFPRVSKTLARQLFEQYGGIARAVLARGHLPAAFTTLQSALTEASPEKILQQVSGPSRKDLVDRLTHIIPNGDLTGHHLDFASAYVRHALAERFIKTKQTDLRGFLLAYEPSGSKYSVLWGHMFEFYALSMLVAANSFKQRNMTTGAAMLELVTTPGNVFTYGDMSETSLKTCLCMPKAKNEAAVDAVLQPCTGLQITRSPVHGLKAAGIRKLIDGLNDRASANVTFCVPSDLFDDYHIQTVEGPLDSRKYPFQQRVIAIPINV